ncbi:MAG: LSU ribosomal protein L21p, partial [uncultured Quadrisphaera sp.]
GVRHRPRRRPSGEGVGGRRPRRRPDRGRQRRQRPAAARPARRRPHDHLRRRDARRHHGHRRGRARRQGPEDHDPEVQEQDRLPQAAGSPQQADPPARHRHRL